MSEDISAYRRSHMPREDQQGYGWTIVRAHPTKALKLMLLSDEFLGIETHYWNHRTGPCRETACEACLAGYVSRWKGYILAIDTATDRSVVLEFTPPGATSMDEAKSRYGTLRGCLASVSRVKPTINGKVQIIVKDRTIIQPGKFEVYGVWDVLSRIWKLKSAAEPKVARAIDSDIVLGEEPNWPV